MNRRIRFKFGLLNGWVSDFGYNHVFTKCLFLFTRRLSSALKELDNVKTEKIALEVRVTELKKRG